jgi:methyltransferase (TIGR00027 family)
MPRGASRTAEIVCFFRAVEQQRPAHVRVVDDALAARLLPPHLKALAALGVTRHLLDRTPSFGPGGLQRYVAARHRVMDELLVRFAGSASGQVVILGAGLDTRAWRFGPEHPGVPFFEVDFPATQAEKRRRLGGDRVAGPGPVFTPVDFERDDVAVALVRAGLDPGRPSLFIWEGVTMYLTLDAIRATLARISAIAAAGSEVVFDAWTQPTASATAWLRRAAGSGLGLIGEPLRCALDEDASRRVLLDTGWAAPAWFDADGLAVRAGLAPGSLYPDIALAHAVRARNAAEDGDG